MTDKQAVALADAHWDSTGVSPWDYGSATIAWLKREGLAFREKTDAGRYRLTAKGRALRVEVMQGQGT